LFFLLEREKDGFQGYYTFNIDLALFKFDM